MRLKTALTHLLAIVSTAVLVTAQSVTEDEQKPKRNQPAVKTMSESVDDAFGTAIGVLTYYPFMNIAGWFGLDTDPQFQRDDDGETKASSSTLAGHTGAVTGALFAPNNTLVLTWGADKTVRLFSVDGKQEASFEHPGLVQAAAFYPKSDEFATACADGKVRVFGSKKVEEKTTWVEKLVVSGSHAGGATMVGYSGDGAWLWSYGADKTLRCWGEFGGKSLEVKTDTLAQVAISNDVEHNDELVFVRDGNGALQVHRANGKVVATVEGLSTRSLAITTDGSRALVRVDDKGFRVLDETGKKISDIAVEDAATTGDIATTEEGVRVTITAPDGTTTIHDDQGEQLSSSKVDPSGFSLSSDERSPNTAALRKRGSNLVWVLSGHTAKLNGRILSTDGTRALTFSDDGTARVWEWFIRGPDSKPVATSIPFVVLWLVIAAVIFTLYMKFVNVRMFGHAIQVVRGKYSNPEDAGEVSHFQALSSALSATVGLGNIAGVAIAVSVGGPGATFWMIVAGLLGMTLKFTECSLGQKFRKIDENGTVSGGPMHYLKDGLSQKGLGILGWPLAGIFTVFCIGGSLAGGNAFQVNQAGSILQGQVPFFEEYPIVFGLALATMVGVVIIGGIQRIAHTAEKIVPTMCGVYVLAAMTILVMNIDEVPGAFGTIFGSALTGDAVYGGALGALIMGFRRAAFSNEAGVGSASIAHSAARTPYAVREGIVALLEPFIDTVVVCTMTALVIVITGVYNAPEHAELIAGNKGAALTSFAFQTNEVLAGWFPWVLMVAVILFAFSTMISWSYYGERCWTNLFGPRSSLSFKIVFLVFTVLGSIVTATNVLEFGDVMILLMAFPNILGLYFLAPLVKKDLKEYEEKLANNEFQTFK